MSSATLVENTLQAFGFCGKIPSKGDFVHGELPQDFSEVWNEWSQSIIGVSREQLGDEWLNEYMISPVWNFALSPGASGQHGMSGVMLPSVDRVGRYFPFTVAQVNHKTPAASALTDFEHFELLNNIALQALEPTNFILQQFQQSLSELSSSEVASLPQYSVDGKTQAGRKTCWQFSLTEGPVTDKSLIDLLHISWKKLFGSYSLWWTQGSEKVAPCLLICDGLPEVGRYAAMLDGNWQQWGWQSHQVING